MSARTLQAAYAAFVALQKGADVAEVVIEQPTETTIEYVPGTVGARRLDVGVLEQAARRAGYRSAAVALRKALETTRGRVGDRDVEEVIGGHVPGSLTRAAVARHLGVDEGALWPRAGEE